MSSDASLVGVYGLASPGKVFSTSRWWLKEDGVVWYKQQEGAEYEPSVYRAVHVEGWWEKGVIERVEEEAESIRLVANEV
jgi:hypothetical protein